MEGVKHQLRSGRRARRVVPLIGLVALIVSLATAGWIWLPRGHQEAGEGLAFDVVDVDLGTVLSGESREFEFSFVNDNPEPVTVAKVLAGCSCTSVRAEPASVLPGKRGRILGTVTFPGSVGSFRERLAVATASRRVHTLRLRADVEPRFTIEPETLDFGDVRWNTALRGRVVVCANSRLRPVPLLRLQDGHSSAISARLMRERQDRWVLDVAVRELQPGSFAQRIFISTGHEPSGALVVPVLARVSGPIKVSPGTLYLGSVLESERRRCEITVTALEKEYLDTVEVATFAIGAAVREREPSGDKSLKLTLEFDFKGREGLIEDTLEVTIRRPDMTVYVPLVAFVSAAESVSVGDAGLR